MQGIPGMDENMWSIAVSMISIGTICFLSGLLYEYCFLLVIRNYKTYRNRNNNGMLFV